MTIESDHKPLQSSFKKSLLHAPCRLQQTMLRLQRYNIDVTYKPGKQMYVADHLSRAFLKDTSPEDEQFQVFALEVEELNPFNVLKINNEKLPKLRNATNQDPVLQTLKSLVLTGWPEQREQVPIHARAYWNYKEELTLYNGILFKNDRIIIPTSMRAEITVKAHSSHQGIQASIRKAKDLVFWPGMCKDIEESVTKCEVCAQFQTKNVKEPMQSQEIPDRPWSRVSSDLFSLNSKDYIVLVDHYSDFIEVAELRDSTSAAIIQFLKEQFSRHGIPDVLVSDNGSQYTSQEFTMFSRKWEFKHVTSSPTYPKSNGKSEAAVKVAKRIFKKALREDGDPWLSLLDQRNTPTEGVNVSPVQRLMSRRSQTLLPVSSKLLHPKVAEHVKEKLKCKRQKAKSYHDRGAKVLPELDIGQDVRVAGQRDKNWQPGTVVNKLSDRSYTVQVNGEVVRRNRVDLRSKRDGGAVEDTPDLQEAAEDLLVGGPPTQISASQSKASVKVSDQTNTNMPKTTTRGRTVKPPSRFKDFVSTLTALYAFFLIHLFCFELFVKEHSIWYAYF